MKKIRLLVSAVLVLCIIVSSIFVAGAEVENESFDCDLHFRGTKSFSNGDVSVMSSNQHWDDDYFNKSSAEFNPKLAKLLSVMACSAYYGNSTRIENITYNLSILGFTDVVTEYKPKNVSYDENSEYYNRDGVAYSIARKVVTYNGKECTLLCVTIKGTSNDEEWYGNFNVGMEQDHAGFKIAANMVRTALEDYVKKYVTTDDVRIITSGHSRGAATANAFAASLIDNPVLGSVSVPTNGVFAYTYATPTTTMREDAHSEKYNGIFNFVNPEDFIGYTPFPHWGYKRFGTDMFLPNRITDSDYATRLTAMQEKFSLNTNGGKYIPFATGAAETILFTQKASSLMPNYTDFYNAKYIVANELLDGHTLMENICDVLINSSAAGTAFSNLLATNDSAYSILTGYILSTYMGSDGASAGFTFAHSPITFMSWVNSLDEAGMKQQRYYKELVYSDKINAYISETESKKIVGIVSSGVVDDTITNGIVSIVEDGYTHIFLPSDGNYTINISNVPTSKFDLACIYSNPNGIVMQNEMFTDVGATASDKFTVVSSADSKLVRMYKGNESGTEINASFQSEYNTPVTAKSDVAQSGAGETIAKETYNCGEVAHLYAYPIESSADKFVCWYQDGKKVSTEKSFFYQVKDNSEISALYLADDAKIIYGDADESKDAPNLQDVVTIQKDLAQISKMTALSRYSCDLNKDDKTSISDAVIIQRYIAGLVTTLPEA